MDGIEFKRIEEDKGRSKSDQVISELINHINSLEEKLSVMETNLADLKDVQLVNKLDIVNLRNEIEKIFAAYPTIDPQTQDVIQDVHELADDIKNIKQFKEMRKTIQSLQESINMTMKEMGDIKKERKMPKKPTIPAESANIFNRCPDCRTMLPRRAKFCTRCGKKMKV